MTKVYAVARLILLLIEYFVSGLRCILFDNFMITSLSWSGKKIKKKKQKIKTDILINYYENLLRNKP